MMKKMSLDEAKEVCEQIIEAVAAVFVGNKPLLRKLLAAGLANGHVLFEDYPGLGKTLLAKVFAKRLPIYPYPVYPRPFARRYCRHQDMAAARLPIRTGQRACLHPCTAGR